MRRQTRTRAVALLMIMVCALALSCSGCREASVGGAIEASGTIEAEEVIVASEFGGRVEQILADEGDAVELGQALIHLDTQLLEAQIGQAQAAVSAAQANLARVESGARPGEIEMAEALLDQAIVARNGAERAWKDTVALRNNPQQLNAQIDEARTQVELAERGVAQTQAQLQTVAIQRDAYAGAGDDGSKTGYAALDQQVRAAEATVASAEETLAGDTATMEDLLGMHDKPVSFETAVNQAKAQYNDASSAVGVAQASLDAWSARPTPEEVGVAQAPVS